MSDPQNTDAKIASLEAQLEEIRQQFAANVRANVSLFRAILETMQKIAAGSPDPQVQAISTSLARTLAEMPEI